MKATLAKVVFHRNPITVYPLYELGALVKYELHRLSGQHSFLPNGYRGIFQRGNAAGA
jgi:hypothetical protein